MKTDISLEEAALGMVQTFLQYLQIQSEKTAAVLLSQRDKELLNLSVRASGHLVGAPLDEAPARLDEPLSISSKKVNR